MLRRIIRMQHICIDIFVIKCELAILRKNIVVQQNVNVANGYSLQLLFIWCEIKRVFSSYTTGQKFGIFEKQNGNSRIWHFNLLQMAWHQPQINMVTLM